MMARDFGFSFLYDNEALLELLSGLTFTLRIPSSLLSLATYVLTALALYKLAQRRGIGKAWLSWIPIVNCWILGSLSDQYQYVVKGQVKNKRKTLLILSLINLVIGAMMAVLAVVAVVQLVFGFTEGASDHMLLEAIAGPVIGILGLCLPVAGIGIAQLVIRFMALYDVYRSMDPGNSVLYLVLSILAPVTEPFFLFFNREKDGGMPPRKQAPQEPVDIPAPESFTYEPWEPDNKDSL